LETRGKKGGLRFKEGRGVNGEGKGRSSLKGTNGGGEEKHTVGAERLQFSEQEIAFGKVQGREKSLRREEEESRGRKVLIGVRRRFHQRAE